MTQERNNILNINNGHVHFVNLVEKFPECRLTLIPDHNLYRNFNCSRILVPLGSIDESEEEKRITNESNFGLPEYMCKEENIKVKTLSVVHVTSKHRDINS